MPFNLENWRMKQLSLQNTKKSVPNKLPVQKYINPNTMRPNNNSTKIGVTDSPVQCSFTNNTAYVIVITSGNDPTFSSNPNGVSIDPYAPPFTWTSPGVSNTYAFNIYDSSNGTPTAFCAGGGGIDQSAGVIGTRGSVDKTNKYYASVNLTGIITYNNGNTTNSYSDPSLNDPNGTYGAWLQYNADWGITAVSYTYTSLNPFKPNPPPWDPNAPIKIKSIYYHQQWDLYGFMWGPKDITLPHYPQLGNTTNGGGRNYWISDIPDDVTDLAYAFWWVDASGNVASGDDGADHEIIPAAGSWGQSPPINLVTPNPNPRFAPTGYQFPPIRGNVLGNFGQLIDLNTARMGRNVAPLNCALTIGGWTFSTYFSDAVSSAANRTNFVKNCIHALNTWSDIFNGINFDWEYLTDNGNNWGYNGGVDDSGNYIPPNNTTSNDLNNFCLFLDELRVAINNTDPTKGTVLPYKKIRIGIPVTTAPEKAQYDVNRFWQKGPNSGMPLVDEIHIMTYDYHSGGWDTQTGFHSNPLAVKNTSAYPSPYYSAEEAVKYYLGLSGQISDGTISNNPITKDTPKPPPRDLSNIGFITGTNVPDKNGNPTILGTPVCPNQNQNKIPLPQVPASMLFVGVAFYSRGFANSKGPYTPGTGLPNIQAIYDTNVNDNGTIPYYQIATLPTLPNTTWGKIMNDPDTLGAYCLDSTNNNFLSFDNSVSINSKVELVKKYGLGGLLAWDNASDIRGNNRTETSVLSPTDSLTSYITEGISQLNGPPNQTEENIKKSKQNINNNGAPISQRERRA